MTQQLPNHLPTHSLKQPNPKIRTSTGKYLIIKPQQCQYSRIPMRNKFCHEPKFSILIFPYCYVFVPGARDQSVRV